jgi:hypothetical protein
MPDPIPGAKPDDAELAAFAGEVQKLATQGGFDPFALFGGVNTFHSVFLAPFSPALRAALERFLADGSGPLAGSVQAFRQQGVPEDVARARAREMFQAAVGMCVVVLAGEGGLATIPQLFFGHVSEEWRRHAIDACGKDFPGREALAQALADLAAKGAGGTTWPALVAGPEAGSNVLGYWLELASGVVASLDEGIIPVGAERLADLGHWIGMAVGLLAKDRPIDPDDQVAVARCRLLAGEWREAGAAIEQAAAEIEDEELVELVAQVAESVVRSGQGREGAAWLAPRIAKLEERTGRCYDFARALFRMQASAQVAAEELLATAELMVARDKKSFRHDLTREPVWIVRLEDPGELLDTAAAATATGRSPAFIAKKLEQGTIPAHRSGDQIRIPAQGLAGWKAVMERYKLLDG